MSIQELYQLYLQYPSVQTDTRKLTAGDLFFALSGPNFDGNTFAEQALNNGAAYAVIDNPAFAISSKFILVPDVLDTLQQLAKYHRQQLDIPFLAITGSNGKTTTKELIAAVLSAKYKTYATEGNLNNHIGVPLTLLKIKADAQIAIIEMGANHLREIAGYCEIALPGYGLITNCGKAHIEGFGGVEGVRKGKGELYDFLRANNGLVFRNNDLEYLAEMSSGIQRQVTYGGPDADYTGIIATKDVFLSVKVPAKSPNLLINTHLVGDYNFPNVMAAVAVGGYFGVEDDDIKKSLEGYVPGNSRSQWLQNGSNRLILDAYNANPSSMKAAIQNFASTDLPHKILWIGAMKEMGPAEEEEHRQLVELISNYLWDSVILVGKEFRGLERNYHWFENSGDAAEFIKAHPPTGSSILIKGSRGSRMEVTAEALPV